MRGSPLTENVADRWSSLTGAVGTRALLLSIVAGAVAGVLAAQIRLHLGLPGHKVLFWMVPILAARLLWRCPVGATMGATTAAGTSFALGGNLAGGFPYVALVVLAGGVLDAVVAFAHARRLSTASTVLLLTAGGMAANLLCLTKRVLTPVYNHLPILGIPGPLATFMSYALFGALAGLLGATLGLSAAKLAAARAKEDHR